MSHSAVSKRPRTISSRDDRVQLPSSLPLPDFWVRVSSKHSVAASRSISVIRRSHCDSGLLDCKRIRVSRELSYGIPRRDVLGSEPDKSVLQRFDVAEYRANYILSHSCSLSFFETEMALFFTSTSNLNWIQTDLGHSVPSFIDLSLEGNRLFKKTSRLHRSIRRFSFADIDTLRLQ